MPFNEHKGRPQARHANAARFPLAATVTIAVLVVLVVAITGRWLS